MLQSTHLTGISSPRFRRCSVGEEAWVLFSKFLFLSCFTSSMIAPQTFSKNRSESSSERIQGSLMGDRYPISYTEAMGIQESHGVYEHLALKLRLLLVGLDHRAQTFFFACLILIQGLASDQ